MLALAGLLGCRAGRGWGRCEPCSMQGRRWRFRGLRESCAMLPDAISMPSRCLRRSLGRARRACAGFGLMSTSCSCLKTLGACAGGFSASRFQELVFELEGGVNVTIGAEARSCELPRLFLSWMRGLLPCDWHAGAEQQDQLLSGPRRLARRTERTERLWNSDAAI